MENESAGASKNANKAVVIITDGDPSDLDKSFQSVATYNRKEITRVVIGVSLNIFFCITRLKDVVDLFDFFFC